jgi:undecaprenyl-diphosphatase
MTVLQAIVLGMVQGLTEFLPVSSSGHLIFFPALFGWADQGLAFDAVIHLGTLVAVVAYFRRDVLDMARGNRKLLGFVLLSAIPAVIVGYFLADAIEGKFRSPVVVAANLILWGLALWAADKYQGMRNQQLGMRNEVTLGRTIVMGIAQVLALVPGTSRSGITMTAGLFCGLDKKTAARFSFLMSIPVIFLAGGSKLLGLVQSDFASVAATPIAVGFFTSLVSGLLAIWILLRVIERWSFFPFVAYRIFIAILIFAAL